MQCIRTKPPTERGGEAPSRPPVAGSLSSCAPGEPNHAVARQQQVRVPPAVPVERGASAVRRVAVDLRDEPVGAPEEIHLVALELDVHLRRRAGRNCRQRARNTSSASERVIVLPARWDAEDIRDHSAAPSSRASGGARRSRDGRYSAWSMARSTARRRHHVGEVGEGAARGGHRDPVRASFDRARAGRSGARGSRRAFARAPGDRDLHRTRSPRRCPRSRPLCGGSRRAPPRRRERPPGCRRARVSTGCPTA